MRAVTDKQIQDAKYPGEIFSMNPATLESEYEAYQQKYKPRPYAGIQNFVIMQQVTLLYREAKKMLLRNTGSDLCDCFDRTLEFYDSEGKYHSYEYTYCKDMKVSKMFATERQVIFVTPARYKAYHDNFVEKVEKKYQRFSRIIWESVEHMIPKIHTKAQTQDGSWVIVLQKPSAKCYPLREVLDYYGGRLAPEYVASILSRLYLFFTYCELVNINYNAFTVDTLFFSPGRFIEEGEPYTVEDMRIVGTFGGWFFATDDHEKLRGIPSEIDRLRSAEERLHGYASVRLNTLAIKRLACELLGDVSGVNLEGTPEKMAEWLRSTTCKENAGEEYAAWEKVMLESFGERRFVDMDVSI